MSSVGKNKKEKMLAIHRHWIWADRIRKEYFELLKANPPAKDDMLDWFLNADGMYMCLWYGLLFLVCEALKRSGFTVAQVQAEIDAIYDSLRLFRNVIFHVNKKYFPKQMFVIMADPTSATKITEAHEGIGKWFLTQIGTAPSVQQTKPS